MSQNAQRLLSQTLKMIPEFARCIERIPSHNFIVNYPLELVQQNIKCIFPNSNIFLKSSATVRPNNNLFFVQAQECFASTNFTGATTSEQQLLSSKLTELKTKYEIFDEDMINRIKLTLGVQANSLDPDMPLNQYAKTVLSYTKNPSVENYIKTNASSGFLKSIINSNKLALSTAYQYLQKSFLKCVKEEDFNNAYQVVRFYSKESNKNRIIFPFCNNIAHSFEPNCEIKVMFLTHRRTTFLSVNSLREIKPGENLTINYGNQNNYELFIRYGFTISDNPFSQFYLPVDFSDIDEIFNSNMDWKMEMFKKNKKFKLKNFIRLNSNGQVHPDDLNMLRIIFSTKPMQKEEFLDDNAFMRNINEKISGFVQKTAERFIIMMQNMEQKKKELGSIQNKKPENEIEGNITHHINLIESEEKKILKKAMGKK